MSIKYFIAVACLFMSAGLTAQKLTVADRTTGQPLANVAIISENPAVMATTNNRGQVDFSGFRGASEIVIRHIGYQTRKLSYAEAEKLNFFIDLAVSRITLNEVVISANRWEQNEREIPQRVEKIGMQQIAFANPQTAADMLSVGGYAYIQKSQLAGGSPILRGFATNRVMLVVDGVRMNNAIFRTGNLQNVISIDAAAVESNEILFGPGAVMYGSDAIGGVMDFHTLSPVFSQNGKTMLKGNAFARFSSANLEKTGHFDFSAGLKKWVFVTSATWSDFDDLKAGSNGNSYFLRPVYQKTENGQDITVENEDPQKQVYSGYSQYSLLQKIAFRPSAGSELDYTFYYSGTSDAPRYDRLCLVNDDGSLVNAQWYYGPQQWMMNRLAARLRSDGGIYDQFRIVAAHQLYKESRHDRKMNNKRLRNQFEEVNAFSLNLDLDKKLSEKLALFYGGEAVYNKVGSEANRRHIETGEVSSVNTRYPDGSTWQSYALYTTARLHLNQKTTVNAGLRYSYVAMEAAFDTSMFPFPFTEASLGKGALNGGLGITWSPLNNWKLYTNFSSGFRSPNIDDLGKVFDSEPGSVVVPNVNLKPEYAWNAEGGFAFTMGDFLKADLSLYYTLLTDALARRDFSYNGLDSIIYDGELSRVQAIQNITRARVFGIQGGFKASLGQGFGLSTVFNWQNGEEQSEDSLKYYPLRHAVPFFGSTHLTWERPKLRFDLYAEYNAGLDYEDLPLSERTDAAPYAKDGNGNPYVPAWITLNFKAAWYINRNFTLNAGLENITDQLYRPFASGISAPGRNFIMALRASF
ncbi:Vitamin B12 transporter BtuB [bioreactor metagenome]|jgi:hemoglobin/transferrin/lactoferrin receptor protein|uniref:Vitamin B12 transporter BtuB n=1 Tax=bioreactor metagenome TaxID=1076179 RepID=A0A644UT54_9ZZZZ|nr:TonB-dependent receptor [Lentimicrobium sp.]MEA5109835.1 TonB-dependent receptor [Lentimicrobium sp.]